MSFDFSLVLLIFSLVTGLIWLFDILALKKPRENRVKVYLEKHHITRDDFNAFLEMVFGDDKGQADGGDGSGDSKDNKDNKQARTSRDKKHLQEAFKLYQEPMVVEYARSFFPIIFAVLILRSFLFEPFQIPTGSMIPTLNVGDFIVVNKYAYGLRLPVVGTKVLDVADPKRGDVMVFIPPHDPNYYIKRVIGLPGDHIRYDNKRVYINGEPLEQEFVEYLNERRSPVVYSLESVGGVTHDIYTSPSPDYVRPGAWLRPEGGIIPEGHYFMMGDNRDNSSDSREWGPVSEKNIVGKAVAVWMHKEPGFNLPSFSQNRFIENPD